MFFICPKCSGELNISESGAAACPKGHSYDKSRFGYYNLLLSERGGTHGDNKEMVMARREFLGGGFYEPLASAIADICDRVLPQCGVVLDAGCGEGYYTRHVKSRLSGKNARVCAFDISKDAVKEAAKKHSADEYAVAGSYHMPIADGSVDLLLNTFSPLAADETRRVVKSGGYFVMAIPAEEHLFGLKAKIYDTPYRNTVEDTSLEGFCLVDKREIRYTLELTDNESIKSLFMMTPYAYRTNREGRGRILSLPELVTEVHFLILVYKKTEPCAIK